MSAMETEKAGHPQINVNQVKHNRGVDDKLDKLGSQLVSADAKAEAAQTAAKMADSLARKTADVASKSMELANITERA
jgi:hypothetical protein